MSLGSCVSQAKSHQAPNQKTTHPSGSRESESNPLGAANSWSRVLAYFLFAKTRNANTAPWLTELFRSRLQARGELPTSCRTVSPQAPSVMRRKEKSGPPTTPDTPTGNQSLLSRPRGTVSPPGLQSCPSTVAKAGSRGPLLRSHHRAESSPFSEVPPCPFLPSHQPSPHTPL